MAILLSAKAKAKTDMPDTSIACLNVIRHLSRERISMIASSVEGMADGICGLKHSFDFLDIIGIFGARCRCFFLLNIRKICA